MNIIATQVRPSNSSDMPAPSKRSQTKLPAKGTTGLPRSWAVSILEVVRVEVFSFLMVILFFCIGLVDAGAGLKAGASSVDVNSVAKRVAEVVMGALEPEVAAAQKFLDEELGDRPYQTEFDAFFTAIADGTPMPLTGLSDAVRAHEIVFAADQSASAGREPVSLGEVREN